MISYNKDRKEILMSEINNRATNKKYSPKKLASQTYHAEEFRQKRYKLNHPLLFRLRKNHFSKKLSDSKLEIHKVDPSHTFTSSVSTDKKSININNVNIMQIFPKYIHLSTEYTNSNFSYEALLRIKNDELSQEYLSLKKRLFHIMFKNGSRPNAYICNLMNKYLNRFYEAYGVLSISRNDKSENYYRMNISNIAHMKNSDWPTTNNLLTYIKDMSNNIPHSGIFFDRNYKLRKKGLKLIYNFCLQLKKYQNGITKITPRDARYVLQSSLGKG